MILVGAVPGPMGYYLRTSEARCSPRRSHPGHWSPGSRLGPWDGARGSPEGRGRQLAAGGVLGGGDGGGFRGWAVVGESGRGDARVEVWVSAAAFGGGGVWRRRRGRGATRQLAPGVSISPVGIGAAGARPTIDPGWQAWHQCVGYIYIYLQRLTPSWQGPVDWSKDRSQDIY